MKFKRKIHERLVSDKVYLDWNFSNWTVGLNFADILMTRYVIECIVDEALFDPHTYAFKYENNTHIPKEYHLQVLTHLQVDSVKNQDKISI